MNGGKNNASGWLLVVSSIEESLDKRCMTKQTGQKNVN